MESSVNDRTYGIVVEMSGPEANADIIGRHVGWIGEGPMPKTACGKPLAHWKNWGMSYPADQLPVAMGTRLCPECRAAAIAHAEQMASA